MHKIEPKILRYKNYAKEINAKIRGKKAPTLPCKNYVKKKKCTNKSQKSTKYYPKKLVVLAYENYAKKNNAQILAKKATNTTLKKLW